MCYDDGSGLTQQTVCAAGNEPHLDCNHDDYYSTRPGSGSYLATHWNTAASSFLATTDPPTTVPPPPPGPTDEPSGASTPPQSLLPTGTLPDAPGAPAAKLQPVRATRLVAPGHGLIRQSAPLDVPVTGRAGVPSAGVQAVVVDITVVAASADGAVTAYPLGRSAPAATTVSAHPGRPQTAMAVVEVGTDGKIRLASRPGSARVTVDLLGWFDADGSRAEGQTSVLPAATVLNTRTGVGGHRAALRPGATRKLVVIGRGGVPTAGVSGVWLGITSRNAHGAGKVVVYPAGRSRPTATTLRYGRGHPASTLALAPVGARGAVRIHNAGARVDLSVTALGWVDNDSDAGTSRYEPVSATRVMDTRRDGSGRVSSGGHRDVQVTGQAGIPSDGVAAATVTVVSSRATSHGWLSCYPSRRKHPTPAVIQYRPSGTTVQTLVVPLDRRGRFRVFDRGAAVQVRVFVLGYFDRAGP
jgi:hypothetical protein